MDSLEKIDEIQEKINAIDYVIALLYEKQEKLELKAGLKVSALNQEDKDYYYNR